MGEKKEEKKKFDYHSSRFFAFLFPAIYLVALAIFCVEYSIIPGPEFLILGFLIYAAYNQRTWRFLKDWLPFITVFVSYEILYGTMGTFARQQVEVLHNLNFLHSGPYNLELYLFHTVPGIVLQQSFRMPIIDYTAAIFYSTHFFAPTIFAFILWRVSPRYYWKYTVAFGLVTYAALITFLFYPVAPPWLNPAISSQVSRTLTTSIDPSLGVPVYRTIFDFLDSDAYAAFPSLHSALPFLISLFAVKIWGKKGLLTLILPIGVWFSVIYLGEHYLVDVFGGILYATAAFLAVTVLLPYLSKKIGFLRKHVPKENENKDIQQTIAQ